MLQNDTKSLVPLVYFDMFYLRLRGATYADIAGKLGYSESHVRRLFAKRGVLHKLWLNYKSEAKESSIDTALNIMFASLPEISQALVEHAKSLGSGSGEARRTVFEYTLGKPLERMKIQTEPEECPKTLAGWIKYEHEKAERKKQQQLERD